MLENKLVLCIGIYTNNMITELKYSLTEKYMHCFKITAVSLASSMYSRIVVIK